jgi:preprotein translocase subunit SecE
LNVANKMAEQKQERRRERESRQPAKRDTRQPQSTSLWKRIRRIRWVSFVFEAYDELRHKVTWPTFQEARNMTIVVILLSAAVSAFLALADLGLLQLFRLISGGS